MIFDSHAHYEDGQFDIDRHELLSGMQASNVGKIVDVGAGIESTKRAIDVAHDYDFVYASVGIHPEDVANMTDEHMEWLRSLLQKDEKIVAVGEIGLDYHYDEPPKDVQKHWFARQLELAYELDKPIIVHSRDAAADTLEIMRAHHGEELGGVIYCFSYSLEMAKIYLDMGYYLGIGGVVTFKNSKKLKEVVQYMPLDRILLETDCPYMAPEPNRGKRNDSRQIKYVVKKIAEIKGVTPEEVETVTWKNAMKMYRLKR